MSADESPKLDSCGCCQPAPGLTAVANRPGLSALAYRIGTHADFLRRMTANLHLQPALERLTTRSADDPAIALLDAWATVADVLTFYQERVANEGYLRTATERRSVLELARAIGYELNPGVAAGAFLAFTVEPAAGAPPSAVIAAGTKVQSIPAQGKRLQTFESSEAITARLEWNELRPRLTQPQPLDPAAPVVYLKGLAAQIQPGDLVLFVEVNNQNVVATTKLVKRVVAEVKAARTRIELDNVPKLPPDHTFKTPGFYAVPTLGAKKLEIGTVASEVANKTWRESSLDAYFSIQGWSGKSVMRHLVGKREKESQGGQEAQEQGSPPPPPNHLPAAQPGLYGFRVRTSPFGHNAPRWASLPPNQRLVAQNNNLPVPYANDWDTTPPSISTDSQGTAYTDFFCERTVPELVRDTWVLVQGPTDVKPYRVNLVREVSLADFALSAKCTGVKLETLGANFLTAPPNELDEFKLRTTTIHAGSRPLDLAPLPITDALGQGTVEATQLMLDSMVLGLRANQAVILTGELDTLPGVSQSEVLFLSDIVHQDGLTTLFFKDPIQDRYIRNTVTVNANVTRATHGESVREVLGSGNAAQARQKFVLKKPPLTYVSAATPSGSATTLSVRANGVLAEEVPSLYGVDAHRLSYIVRIEDDGTTAVTFGDGRSGARLPSGTENIVAAYRSGIGPDGEVDAGSLTLLPVRPPGIRGVTNPLPAGGAAAPENLGAARTNAPMTVLTLDRIVSLQDFEDFARTFAGIGKAHAVTQWHGRVRLVHITIASASGNEVAVSSDTYKNLKNAIDAVRASELPVVLNSFRRRYFDLQAKLLVDPRYAFENVRAAADAALRQAFSFEARAFAQPVTAAEVVAVLQGVPGVVATDLDVLAEVTAGSTAPPSSLSMRIAADPAGFDDTLNDFVGAVLLLLSPAGPSLTEMKP